MDNKKALKKATNIFLEDMIFNGASSASIMIYQKGELGYYQSTGDKWQDFYSSSNEAKQCHLAQLGIKLAKEKNLLL